MPRARPAARSVYHVLVTLQRIEPPIWRRLLLPSDLGFGKLHRVLHCVFDWEHYHLHQFVVGNTFYGLPDPEWGDDLPMIDERTVPLSRVLTKVGDTIVYEYEAQPQQFYGQPQSSVLWLCYQLKRVAW